MTDILRSDRDKLEKHLTVRRWMRNKAEATQINYLSSMVRFQQRTGMDPDQFLAWAKKADGVEVTDMVEKSAEGLKESVGFLLKSDIRSFLRHNGYNNMPKPTDKYTLQDWHRGYKKPEVHQLIEYLNDPVRKMAVYGCVESGLRINTVLELRYHHISEDFDKDIVPCAIRLEPKFYVGRKSAGYTFLGEKCVSLLHDAIKHKLVKTKPDSLLIPIRYSALYLPIIRARERAHLDPKIQPFHGLRKYFENSLDSANVDHEKKMILEGHFAGTRAKHYTDRDWDELREIYKQAYPHISVDTDDTGLGKRILGLEEENAQLKDRVQTLEAQLINADKESMTKLQAAAKDLGFDLGILVDEILNRARRRQRQKSA